jgi:hypothetical protein
VLVDSRQLTSLTGGGSGEGEGSKGKSEDSKGESEDSNGQRA